MSKTFLEGVKTPFAGLVKSYEVKDKDGNKSELPYLPWPRALALAERPQQTIQYWHGAPALWMLGGAVVAIAQPLAVDEAFGAPPVQITYLPILGGDNRPIATARVDPRDITDTINRCRAKSAGIVSGVGLSLYSKGQRDTVKFLKALNVRPDSDLAQVEPLIVKKEGKAQYIDWPSAVAAARITDPTFRWEVEWHEVVDKTTGAIEQLPVLRAGTGWAVTVKLTYRGQTHTEMLPIMGQVMMKTKSGEKLLDHQALPNPTVHDWNRAVMRCLVKGIAMLTGYGLSVYANEEVSALHVEPLQPVPAATPAQPAEQEPQVPQDPAAHAELVNLVADVLTAKNRKVNDLLSWLGCGEARALEELSLGDLQRALSALTGAPVASSNATH